MTYKPTGKSRGRPRNDGLASGSPEAKAADRRPRIRGAVRSGPNAPGSLDTGDRVLTVLFPLIENAEGKNPADLAIEFLELLKIPEGKHAGEPLRLAEFQRRFVRGALAEGIMIGVLSIGRGNAKTALSAKRQRS